MRSRGHSSVAALVVAAVVACAGCTPYKSLGLMGGVDDLQLNASSYRIYARGNGFTSPERVHDFILLRASQLAILHGFEGFVIDSNENQTETSTMVFPGTVHTVSFPGVGSGGPIPMPGFTSTVVDPPIISNITKPADMSYVTLVHHGGINADLIYDRLAPEYGVTQLTDTLSATDIPVVHSGSTTISREGGAATIRAAPGSSAGSPPAGERVVTPRADMRRPLGIIAEPAFPSIAGRYDAAIPIGLLVDSVQAGGSASAAGLRRDDIIVSLSGRPIRSQEDIENALRSIPPGGSATMEILRSGKRRRVQLRF